MNFFNSFDLVRSKTKKTTTTTSSPINNKEIRDDLVCNHFAEPKYAVWKLLPVCYRLREAKYAVLKLFSVCNGFRKWKETFKKQLPVFYRFRGSKYAVLKLLPVFYRFREGKSCVWKLLPVCNGFREYKFDPENQNMLFQSDFRFEMFVCGFNGWLFWTPEKLHSAYTYPPHYTEKFTCVGIGCPSQYFEEKVIYYFLNFYLIFFWREDLSEDDVFTC